MFTPPFTSVAGVPIRKWIRFGKENNGRDYYFMCQVGECWAWDPERLKAPRADRLCILPKIWQPIALGHVQVLWSREADSTEPPRPVVAAPPPPKKHYHEKIAVQEVITNVCSPKNNEEWLSLKFVELDRRQAEALKAYKRRTHSWPCCCGEPCEVAYSPGKIGVHILCAVERRRNV